MLKEDILEILSNNKINYKSFDSLLIFLSSKTGRGIDDVKNSISELIKQGKLLEERRNKFVVLPNKDYVSGKIIGNQRGFAFLNVKGYEEDVFIPERKTKGAYDGDKVIVKIIGRSDSGIDGEVVKILERANDKVVGDVYKTGSGYFVKADNDKLNLKIRIGKGKLNSAKVDDKVVVKLDFSFIKNGEIRGEVIEIIGAKDDIQSLELGIIREHNLYEYFPDDVINECQKLNKQLSVQDKKNRVDLTKMTTFTIDGFDAKDFDDAVSIERTENGYSLGVHIADVGHYVKRGSKLDEEAYNRGTSVYFPRMVLPMLPEEISNGTCSLKENEERLTLSVLMDIDKKGKVTNYKICEAVIKSKARLTYKEVYASLMGEKVNEKVDALHDKFMIMNELSKILEKNRIARGALDLDIPEPQFLFDENGIVSGVMRRERNDAHKLIESFMLLCNEVIAKHFYNKALPFIYRIHEVPNSEKVKDTCAFIESFGISVPKLPDKITPAYFGELLKRVEGKPYTGTINKVILRAMQKARYSPSCLGHFGLASTFYCHFTSPIRRYPDLCIHRIIKDSINGKINPKKMLLLEDFVFEASEESSVREKLAEKAEREVDDLERAVLMRNRVGEEFDAVISSVVNFGVFVELDNTVEGLARIENLPQDNYLFLDKSLTLKGSSNIFKVGDRVKVKLIASNIYTRKIDFQVISKEKNAKI